MRELIRRLRSARVIDLAQEWRAGMPHWPTHPPFAYTLTRLHGETVLPGGGSSAADAIAMGTHVGTHMDALCHFSLGGMLCGGVRVEGRQSYTGGVETHGMETVAPVVRRGVLLDVARAEGVEAVAEDFEVTPATLEECESAAGVEVGEGDVVLLRTGWARYWNDPGRFLNGQRTPGPALEGARWFSSRGVFAVGSDTAAFEKIPSPRMDVHVHLLAEEGIHIFECLNLEVLAGAGAAEFVFVASPLKMRGATGSPVRPFALVAG